MAPKGLQGGLPPYTKDHAGNTAAAAGSAPGLLGRPREAQEKGAPPPPDDAVKAMVATMQEAVTQSARGVASQGSGPSGDDAVEAAQQSWEQQQQSALNSALTNLADLTAWKRGNQHGVVDLNGLTTLLALLRQAAKAAKHGASGAVDPPGAEPSSETLALVLWVLMNLAANEVRRASSAVRPPPPATDTHACAHARTHATRGVRQTVESTTYKHMLTTLRTHAVARAAHRGRARLHRRPDRAAAAGAGAGAAARWRQQLVATRRRVCRALPRQPHALQPGGQGGRDQGVCAYARACMCVCACVCVCVRVYTFVCVSSPHAGVQVPFTTPKLPNARSTRQLQATPTNPNPPPKRPQAGAVAIAADLLLTTSVGDEGATKVSDDASALQLRSLWGVGLSEVSV
jgi:hypothetical protein